MGIIEGDHGVDRQSTPSPAQTPGAVRSPYCYLFEGLANDPVAGLFPQTTAEETLARLRAFEKQYRGLDPLAPVRMKLAPVYTYFGQFVNHDLSAPVGGLAAEAADIAPAAVIGMNAGDPPGLTKQVRADSVRPILERVLNEHGAPLTLDSLYADGPQSHDVQVRAMYRADKMRFVLLRAVRVDDTVIQEQAKILVRVVHPVGGASDIPRIAGKALIADQRNDENLILSQLHLALMLLHNKAVDALHDTFDTPAACFTAARALVTRHYQWCILHDYLEKLLSPGVLAKALAQPARLPRANQVPMEFTAAAFRFGHSMVSQTYDYNANFGMGGALRDHAKLQELFDFTSRKGMLPFIGAVQLPDHWLADWDRLTRTPQDAAFGADAIDMTFAPDMLNLMGNRVALEHGSIFFRNIIRGFHRRMPFGQDLARAYGLDPLSDADVRSALPAVMRRHPAAQHFETHTPAWLYFLCEAEVKESGQRLGPTASNIIADTIVGLLKRNENSILGTTAAGWHPKDSALKIAPDAPLDSLRSLLMFAVT